MNTINNINPVTEERLSHLFTKSIIFSFLENCAISAGTEISAEAKITGVTPEELSLNGSTRLAR